MTTREKQIRTIEAELTETKEHAKEGKPGAATMVRFLIKTLRELGKEV